MYQCRKKNAVLFSNYKQWNHLGNMICVWTASFDADNVREVYLWNVCISKGGDLTSTVTKFYWFICVCVYECLHAFIYLFVLRPVSFCKFGGSGTHRTAQGVSNMPRLSFLCPHWIHHQSGLCAKQEQRVDSEPCSAPAHIYYVSLTKI